VSDIMQILQRNRVLDDSLGFARLCGAGPEQ
jgi:hypothetical protein